MSRKAATYTGSGMENEVRVAKSTEMEMKVDGKKIKMVSEEV